MTAATLNREAGEPFAEITARIAAIGPKSDEAVLNEMRAIYAPLVAQQSSAGVTVNTDLAYGSDPRQKLDVYRGQGQKRPILVSIPGGGFVGGDKNLYGNLGIYFAKHGYLTVIANYRLAPGAPWPAGAQDVAGAVAWAKANGAQYGGDPSRIIVYGQSAGSTHVASYLFDPQFKAEGITAGILMCAPYKFVAPERPNLVAYLGADPSTYAARSPLTHVNNSRVPLLLCVAEFDPCLLSEPTFELAAAVTRRDGKAPHIAFMTGHNHFSTVLGLGSGQDDFGEKVREFLDRF